MRILFLHRDLPPDTFTGVAIQVHRLANALTDAGHEVSVYTHTAQPAEARYRVLPIDLPGLRTALRLIPFLKRIWYPFWYRRLDMDGYHAVHVHGDGGFIRYRGNFVRTFYGTAALEFRYARTWKGKLAQGFSYWMEKREARRCRITVGISPHVAAHLPGVDHVIPCMLDGAADRSGTAKTTYPSLIFLGSRLSRKRGEEALEIFRGLRKTHPDLRLNYVGPQAEIDSLRMRSGYDGVSFHARISQQELDDLYAKSWIYLCLSSYEGFGVGIIEAMAHSCLVITSPHPGSEYLVRDGDTGLLAPLEGAQALVERMLLDGDARAEITRRAREFSQRFHPAVVAASYADLYRMAHARASGTP